VDQARPIIIKRRKGGGDDGGHHGGAWKVAYADFVTAMMAFFLLMWLLNATSEEQRKGLADYFDPSIPISRNSAGGAGMLGGEDVLVPPDASGTRAEGERAKPTHAEEGEDLGDLDRSPDRPEGDAAPDTVAGFQTAAAAGEAGDQGPGPGRGTDGAGGADREAVVDRSTGAGTVGEGAGGPGDQGLAGAPVDAALRDLSDDLEAQVRALDQGGLMQHFSMRLAPEGLVIEIGDLLRRPLYTSGASTPEPVLRELIAILVPVLNHTTNDIAVIGHTDATPFTGTGDYSNWELSADRANAARRLLTEVGLAAQRIVRISGKAATDPISDDPHDPRNRRIAITLLRRDRDPD